MLAICYFGKNVKNIEFFCIFIILVIIDLLLIRLIFTDVYKIF